MTLNLFDTKRRKITPFIPIKKDEVGLYSCGPTVYDFAHVGNLRTYLFVDILKRVLTFNGYSVKHVMNITDVGHLVSDGDTGEDKMEKGSRIHKQSAWDIAKKFELRFLEDIKDLNVEKPTVVCRATDHINEQIEFIKVLEQKGYTYINNDGVYFDTSKIKSYGDLARLDIDGLRAGARVALSEKKNKTDFALWKFSGKSKRQMEWDSPWATGFPGWHIECSAMAEKYLGDLFDIHVGGEDHIPVHHTNEIAQSQAKNSTQMANIWMHGYFLQIDNEKVAKSGKSLTLSALVAEGFSPLSYRYLILTAHYRNQLNFTWESLAGATNALKRIKRLILSFEDGGIADKVYVDAFRGLINNDLNTPKALALMWKMLESDLSTATKKATLLIFDKIFGLGLAQIEREPVKISDIAKQLAEKRYESRRNENWALSDQLREELLTLGYQVEDQIDGYKLIEIG